MGHMVQQGRYAFSHNGVDALVFNTRDVKGTGTWVESTLVGPVGHEDLLWPRAVTNGTDNMTFHVFSTITPVNNGGSIYNGMDGALLYNRSLDGGVTWDINNIQPPEVTSDEYLAIGGDYYTIAEPKGDILAFVVGGKWTDMFLLKSTNNGDDWEKTLIWEHPYPLFDWNVTVTDTFYACDGGMGAAIDNYGDVHVVFGITRVGHFEPGNTYTGYPLVNGLAYWNESMPMFSDGQNTLNPYGHIDSELIENVNFIGWAQYVNGNGSL